MPFVCSICEEESTRICVRCTKDTCSNHLCEKCGACSDCCDCEIHLDEEPRHEPEQAIYSNNDSNGAGGAPAWTHEPGAVPARDLAEEE